jgi:hypothetical protein
MGRNSPDTAIEETSRTSHEYREEEAVFAISDSNSLFARVSRQGNTY